MSTRTNNVGGWQESRVERGGERTETAKSLFGAGKVVVDNCAESFNSNGVTATTGNCMGGATSVNQGIFIQQSADWLINRIDNFFSTEEITEAFDWVRERVAPEPTKELLSGSQLHIAKLVETLDDSADFTVVNVDPGQPEIVSAGVWRTHSTFDPDTGERRSADTVLDRNNENLDIRTNAEVARILFDGDIRIPWHARQPPGATPSARCVQFTSFEVVCIKKGGRIFLSAGAFHSPVLLMKSGIGPGGWNVDNPDVSSCDAAQSTKSSLHTHFAPMPVLSQVGQHLSDKPLVLVAANFIPTYDIAGHLSFGHIAATEPVDVGGQLTTVLYEEVCFGVPVLLDLASFERNFLPRSSRYSLLGAVSLFGLNQCQKKGLIPTALELLSFCSGIDDLVEAGCDKRVLGLAVMAAEPTSRGSVSIGHGGSINVDVNYMDTSHDKTAIGYGVRQARNLITSITGPTATQRPCDDPKTEDCLSTSCPEIQTRVNPFSGGGTPSTIFPGSIETALLSSEDNEQAGSLLREDVIAAHHFAGTAQFGKVVDSTFKVIGTEGLYVVDASVLPVTAQVNTMATTMMLGRLAGKSVV
jgi:hypothetical protein